MSLDKEKWLFVSIYEPTSENSQFFLGILTLFMMDGERGGGVQKGLLPVFPLQLLQTYKLGPKTF